MNEHRYMALRKRTTWLARLRLMEGILDPTTTRHLELVGVTEGWKCLEVGAGAGSVAECLSARVGTTGSVVATDVDARFLKQVKTPNIEVRKHDIYSDDLEAGHYDLAHCRTALMQVPEPKKALKRMADAVRSGGWLMIEETDYGSILSADVTNPTAVPLTTILRAGNDFVRKKRIVDPYLGCHVRELVEGLGFTNIMHEGWTCVCRGSSQIRFP